MFSQSAISISVISNHSSFRLLLDKISSAYFIGKIYISILASEMASAGNQHCANGIGTLSCPYNVLAYTYPELSHSQSEIEYRRLSAFSSVF